MLYYKVKPEYDGRRRWIENDKGQVLVNGEYIGGELYTVRELSYHRLSIIQMDNMFTKINIPRTKTFKCFGARFQMGDDADDET